MALLSIFGIGTIKNALRKGAVVIDVRTPQEFDRGRVPDSINIPVDRIVASAARIKDMKLPVIFCCNSGIRSKTARNIMKSKGLKEVYSAGSWEKLIKIINSL